MFSWFIFGLFDLISAPPLPLSHIGYPIVLLCFVCFVVSLYLGFRVCEGHVTLARAEHCFVTFVEILCIFPMYIQHTTVYSFT